jgi:hypothetical protein
MKEDMSSVLDESKIRELVTSSDESERNLGYQFLCNRNHDLFLRDRKPELWRGRKSVLCEHLYHEPHWGKVILTSTFVELHAKETPIGRPPNWWIVSERTGKVIEKYDVIDLREGFNLWQETEIKLDLWDRLRVLFGAKLSLRTERSVDKEVIVSKGSARITIGTPKGKPVQLESFDQSGKLS